MTHPRNQGFTLIELLVVIAIISILASILFPVFSRARAKGRQAACISNIYQISLAINMYGQDYDEIIVRGDMNNGTAGVTSGQWYNAIFPYTRNRQIMFCPDRADSGPGYGLNCFASGVALGTFWDPAVKILIADVPPECLQNPMPGDGKVSNWGHWWANNPGNTSVPYDDSFMGHNLPQRHNDGVVFGYVDGHAKWGREEQANNPIAWVPAQASE